MFVLKWPLGLLLLAGFASGCQKSGLFFEWKVLRASKPVLVDFCPCKGATGVLDMLEAVRKKGSDKFDVYLVDTSASKAHLELAQKYEVKANSRTYMLFDKGKPVKRSALMDILGAACPRGDGGNIYCDGGAAQDALLAFATNP
ncbi:MAG: hypothetical protein Q7R35_17850 [Elusimicrobiota bacterium]|nr:hypothetical protein [Elusimicrobiota bacterium]